jgi:hypothetical protein
MIDRFLGIGLIFKCFSECIYKHMVFDYFISDSLLLFLMFYVLLTYLTRRVSLVVEELLTLPENQSSPPFLMGVIKIRNRRRTDNKMSNEKGQKDKQRSSKHYT